MRVYPAGTSNLAVRSQFAALHDPGIHTDVSAGQQAYPVIDEYVFAQPDAFRDRGAGCLQTDNRPAPALDARIGGKAALVEETGVVANGDYTAFPRGS